MKNLTDIRQSDNWGKYLSTLGFYHKRTPGGVMMVFKKILGVSLVKIQRPRPLTTQDIKEIEDLGKQEKAALIKIEPNIGQDQSLLTEAGYITSMTPLAVPTTIYIDLEKSEEDLWNSISHSGRYSIHRAEREGVQIKFYENPPEESLTKFHEVFKETSEKKSFYMIPLRETLSRAKSFGRESFVVAAYDREGKLAGAKLYLAHNGLVLYSLGGTTELARKTKAGYELLWRSILYFKGLGYKVMDLEGKNDKRFPFFTSRWEGFSHFKEKFGGEEVRFPVPYTKFTNPILQFMSKLIPVGF